MATKKILRCKMMANGLLSGDQYMCVKPAKHTGDHEWSWKRGAINAG